MKKRNLFPISAAALVALAMSACSPKETVPTFSVNGVGLDAQDSSVVYLSNAKGASIDSSLVIGGTFSFTGPADSVMVANIGFKGQRPKSRIFIEPGIIQVDVKEHVAKGTQLNDEYANFVTTLMATPEEEGEKVERKLAQEIYDRHTNDLLGLQMMNTLAYYYNYDELKAALDSAGDLIKGNKALQNKLGAKQREQQTAVGQPYVDVKGIDALKGDSLALSSFIGKKKLTLVDFWASWCGPCRREIPNIAAVQKKYGKQLNVVGIAVWDELNDTQKAMQDLSISWPVISERNATEPYGILGIPHIMLIDKNGVIIARYLHGEGIATAIEEALKN